MRRALALESNTSKQYDHVFRVNLWTRCHDQPSRHIQFSPVCAFVPTTMTDVVQHDRNEIIEGSEDEFDDFAKGFLGMCLYIPSGTDLTHPR